MNANHRLRAQDKPFSVHMVNAKGSGVHGARFVHGEGGYSFRSRGERNDVNDMKKQRRRFCAAAYRVPASGDAKCPANHPDTTHITKKKPPRYSTVKKQSSGEGRPIASTSETSLIGF
jgi:hypothetical protein